MRSGELAEYPVQSGGEQVTLVKIVSLSMTEAT